MKTHSCLIAILMVIAGCTGSNSTLDKAEQLMEKRPDSAWTVLQRYNPRNAQLQSQSARYALLCTQALVKLNRTPDSDSLIRIATSYYDSGDPLRAAYAWYYQSCVEHTAGKTEQEATSLIAAQGFAQQTNAPRLNALICLAKADIYAAQHSPDSAKKYNRTAAVFFRQAHDYYNEALSFLRIGAFLATKDSNADSAKLYLNKALTIVNAHPDTIQKIVIISSMANVYKLRKEYAQALKLLHSIPHSGYPIYDNNKYLTLADLYWQLKMIDSMEFYLNKTDTSVDIKPYYHYLWMHACEIRGDLNGALHFSKRITTIKDSIFEHTLNVNFAGMERAYQLQHQATDSMWSPSRNSRLFSIATCVLILTIFAGWRYRVRQQMARKNTEQTDATAGNSSAGNAPRSLQPEQLEMFNILRSNIEQHKKNASKQKNEFSTNSAIVGNVTLMKEIIVYMDVKHNNISARLSKTYPSLSQRDVLICCMVLDGYDSGMIAYVLDINHDSVNKSRYRIRKKFKLPTECSLLDFLKTF